jgi:hypothetical protein
MCARLTQPTYHKLAISEGWKLAISEGWKLAISEGWKLTTRANKKGRPAGRPFKVAKVG